jgi:hypothetical protein
MHPPDKLPFSSALDRVLISIQITVEVFKQLRSSRKTGASGENGVL